MKLLIVNRSQFGYHLDCYYYCRHAPDDAAITYLCCSAAREEIPGEKTRVIMIPPQSGPLAGKVQFLLFFLRAFRESLLGEYDIVFIKYFPACSLLRILIPWRRFVLDIRTGSVYKNRNRKEWANRILRLEGFFFRHISVISYGLAERLHIPKRKCYLLPLGANPLADAPSRNFDRLDLLYVGIFSNRDIHHTLEGCRLFRRNHPEIAITYRLVGCGTPEEEARLRRIAESPELAGRVEFLGYVHHRELEKFWREANVGVAYVPITEVYQSQPPTKTFEYLAAGMPVLATATGENGKIVNTGNGVLIQDNPTDFANGLYELWQRRRQYNCREIQRSISEYSWYKITADFFAFLERTAG